MSLTAAAAIAPVLFVETEPRLRFEIAPKGRAVQMNAAARQARGEWLLFLHAETGFSQNPLKPIRYDNLFRNRTCKVRLALVS